VSVRVLPEQRQISAAARQLHTSKRSYPLADVASLFLSKPNACYIRIDAQQTGTGGKLFQCSACKVTALDRSAAVGHVTKTHFQEYFERVETEIEAPRGNFTCVARCGLSGVLLGPPNHHSYNERVNELHGTRFADMPLEEYQQRIEIVHDESLIEKWKEDTRKQVRYRRKDAPAEEEPVKWLDAEDVFVKQVVPGLVQETRKAVLPLDVARQTDDQVLRRILRDAFESEHRFPRSLLLALRAAFRHKHLHVFRAGRRFEFVTAIRPRPLDPDHAIAPIREVLMHLHDHPGRTREKLLEALRPGSSPDSPEGREVLSPLGWLIDRGHIIEFFDGTLSVPLR